MFGSFRAPVPAGVRQTLVFRKTPDAGLMGSVTGWRTDVEPIFLLGPWPKRNAERSSVVESRIGLQRLQAGDSHPHAKPLDVMIQLLSACPPGVVLDPFMGSGSTLRAAKDLGRLAIGIEVERALLPARSRALRTGSPSAIGVALRNRVGTLRTIRHSCLAGQMRLRAMQWMGGAYCLASPPLRSGRAG